MTRWRPLIGTVLISMAIANIAFTHAEAQSADRDTKKAKPETKSKSTFSGKFSLQHLKALIERLQPLNENILGGYYPKTRPLVTIEQFFKGSNGGASLWDNQWPPVPKTVDEIAFWRSIRDRSDVWDVLISISQYDFHTQPFEDEGWVVADVVVVITSASREQVLGWFPKNAVPEFMGESWEQLGEHERVFVPKGMKALFFVYD